MYGFYSQIDRFQIFSVIHKIFRVECTLTRIESFVDIIYEDHTQKRSGGNRRIDKYSWLTATGMTRQSTCGTREGTATPIHGVSLNIIAST